MTPNALLSSFDLSDGPVAATGPRLSRQTAERLQAPHVRSKIAALSRLPDTACNTLWPSATGWELIDGLSDRRQINIKCREKWPESFAAPTTLQLPDLTGAHRREPALKTFQQFTVEHRASNLQEQMSTPRLVQHMYWPFPSRLPIKRLTVPSTALVEIRRPSLLHRP
jgi:hypothetical protein